MDSGRTRGPYVTRGENVADVPGVAVPATVGEDVLAMAVAGPRHRGAPRRERHAAALLAARREPEGTG